MIKRSGYSMIKDDGFTLIELMVIIVIIGILAGFAVPKMFGMDLKSNFCTLSEDYTEYCLEDLSNNRESIIKKRETDTNYVYTTFLNENPARKAFVIRMVKINTGKLVKKVVEVAVPSEVPMDDMDIHTSKPTKVDSAINQSYDSINAQVDKILEGI